MTSPEMIHLSLLLPPAFTWQTKQRVKDTGPCWSASQLYSLLGAMTALLRSGRTFSPHPHGGSEWGRGRGYRSCFSGTPNGWWRQRSPWKWENKGSLTVPLMQWPTSGINVKDKNDKCKKIRLKKGVAQKEEKWEVIPWLGCCSLLMAGANKHLGKNLREEQIRPS